METLIHIISFVVLIGVFLLLKVKFNRGILFSGLISFFSTVIVVGLITPQSVLDERAQRHAADEKRIEKMRQTATVKPSLPLEAEQSCRESIRQQASKYGKVDINIFGNNRTYRDGGEFGRDHWVMVFGFDVTNVFNVKTEAKGKCFYYPNSGETTPATIVKVY